MKVETQEWVDFAEQDWHVVHQLLDITKNFSPKAVCFHAQQSAEMYFKARLTEAVIYFPKTHNLGDLLDLVLLIEPEWKTLRPAVVILTRYAVPTRYPGSVVSREDAESARKLCAEVRAVIRPALGLSI